MTPPASLPDYCAYLLRCWRIGNQQAADVQGWRFSLEDPHTSARHTFASFDALVTFLRDTLMADPCSSVEGRVDERLNESD